MEQSLALFQKRDDLDELEGFQQQELAKVKHMVRQRGFGLLFHLPHSTSKYTSVSKYMDLAAE